MSADLERRIVVGIDGDAESAAALRWALQEAVASHASVEVVHCYPPKEKAFFGTGTESHAESIRLLQISVAAALRSMVKKPAVSESSVPGTPRTVLVERSDQALFLVLGVHAGTELPDFVLGRTGGACVRHARCPIVIVGLDQQVRHHPAAG